MLRVYCVCVWKLYIENNFFFLKILIIENKSLSMGCDHDLKNKWKLSSQNSRDGTCTKILVFITNKRKCNYFTRYLDFGFSRTVTVYRNDYGRRYYRIVTVYSDVHFLMRRTQQLDPGNDDLKNKKTSSAPPRLRRAFYSLYTRV